MTSNNQGNQFKPNGTGPLRIIKAFRCSMLGFKACYQHESAFRQELLLCAGLLPFSFIISTTLTMWTVLIVSMLFLLFAEVINSAIEALADQISTDHHELIGRAKDLGSLAVPLAMTILIFVWANAAYQFIVA